MPFGAKGAVLAGGLKTVAPAAGNTAGNTIVWGNQIIDGVITMFVSGGTQADAFNILWGTATGPIVKATNIVWGNGIVWGRNLVAGRVTGLRDASSAQNIVWGDNIVWGNNRLSGQNIVWGFQQLAASGRNILWGTWDGSRVIYGNSAALGDTVIYGTVSFPRIRRLERRRRTISSGAMCQALNRLGQRLRSVLPAIALGLGLGTANAASNKPNSHPRV